MFEITATQYEKLISKALFISKSCAYDIVHDSLLKYDTYEECVLKMKYEKTKYNTVTEIDLTVLFENKVCIKCNNIYPISSFEIYKYGSFLSTKNICSECNYIHRKEYDQLNRHKINKRLRLKYEKDIDFRKKKDTTSTNWKKKNKEKYNEYQREFREKNKERQLSYRKKYEETNKERILEKRRKYLAENKEKIKAKDKIWREKNKNTLLEKRRAYEKTRRSKNSL